MRTREEPTLSNEEDEESLAKELLKLTVVSIFEYAHEQLDICNLFSSSDDMCDKLALVIFFVTRKNFVRVYMCGEGYYKYSSARAMAAFCCKKSGVQ